MPLIITVVLIGAMAACEPRKQEALPAGVAFDQVTLTFDDARMVRESGRAGSRAVVLSSDPRMGTLVGLELGSCEKVARVFQRGKPPQLVVLIEERQLKENEACASIAQALGLRIAQGVTVEGGVVVEVSEA